MLSKHTPPGAKIVYRPVRPNIEVLPDLVENAAYTLDLIAPCRGDTYGVLLVETSAAHATPVAFEGRFYRPCYHPENFVPAVQPKWMLQLLDVVPVERRVRAPEMAQA